jgi:hypothetical protein
MRLGEGWVMSWVISWVMGWVISWVIGAVPSCDLFFSSPCNPTYLLIVSVKDMFQRVFFIDKILPEIINDTGAFAVW